MTKSCLHTACLCLFFFFIAFVTVNCGGGGSGSGSGVSASGDGAIDPGAPAISNLQLSPTQAYLNSGNGAVNISGRFNCSDSKGDVSTVTLVTFDESGAEIGRKTESISDATGVQAGVVTVTTTLHTRTLGNFAFQVFVTDAHGVSSNVLFVIIIIVEEPKPPASSKPSISSLQFSPTQAYLNSGNATLTGSFNFSDAGGDLSTVTLVTFNESGAETGRKTESINNAMGLTTGVIGVSTTLSTQVLGNFPFQVYVTDAHGFSSNVLLGTFKVIEETKPWISRAPMNTARCSMRAATINDKVYVVGGYNGAALHTVEQYDPATNTWTGKAPMPTARIGFEVGVIDGKLYAVGGQDDAQNLLATVEQYDPVTNTWTTKAPMRAGHAELTVGVVGRKLYAIDSYDRTVEEYNPDTNTWRKMASTVPGQRQLVAAGTVNDRIYVIGGVDTNGNSLQTVEEYNPATDTWTTKSPMPAARYVLTVAVDNGQIYAIGGGDFTKNVSSRVDRYNPLTNTWSNKTDMITGRSALTSATVNGKVYAIGGNESSTYYVTRLEQYDPAKDQ
jgi:N-acetylneuraminic acid mutarotase